MGGLEVGGGCGETDVKVCECVDRNQVFFVCIHFTLGKSASLMVALAGAPAFKADNVV